MRLKDTIGISHYLRKLDLLMRQKIDRALGPLKLTFPKYSILSILEEERSLTNAELSRRAFVTPQTMNKIMQGLLEDKLIQKDIQSKNQLKIHYILTKKGHQRICDAHVEIDKVEKMMINGIGAKKFKELQDYISIMENNLKINLED